MLVIISCHDLSILQMMSDEILLLESGRVVKHLFAPDFTNNKGRIDNEIKDTYIVSYCNYTRECDFI